MSAQRLSERALRRIRDARCDRGRVGETAAVVVADRVTVGKALITGIGEEGTGGAYAFHGISQGAERLGAVGATFTKGAKVEARL